MNTKIIYFEIQLLLNSIFFFFFNAPAPPETYPFPRPAPLPIWRPRQQRGAAGGAGGTAASSKVHFGPVQVDLATHEVRRAGQPVHLTPIEFRLLAALIAAQGRGLTHPQLLLQVWGPEYLSRAH